MDYICPNGVGASVIKRHARNKVENPCEWPHIGSAISHDDHAYFITIVARLRVFEVLQGSFSGEV